MAALVFSSSLVVYVLTRLLSATDLSASEAFFASAHSASFSARGNLHRTHPRTHTHTHTPTHTHTHTHMTTTPARRKKHTRTGGASQQPRAKQRSAGAGCW